MNVWRLPNKNSHDKIRTHKCNSSILTSSFAQQATVKINFKSATDSKVVVQLPVDGTTFYLNRSTKNFDRDSNLVINFPVDKIANVYFINSDRQYRFLIEPGQTNITLNLKKKDSTGIIYRGSSARGQQLINFRSRDFYQERAERYLKMDSTATGVMKLIAIDEQKELQPYQDLLQKRKISSNFYESIKADIAMDFLTIATHIPISIFFDSSRANSKVVFKDEFKALWKELYDKDPFNNPLNWNTSEYYFLAEYYSMYYIGSFLPRNNGTWVKPDYSNPNIMLLNAYQGFSNNFKGKNREYIMASFLFNEMLQKKYQSALLDLYRNFQEEYPTSKYSPLLKPMADEIVRFLAASKTEFAADQQIMADYTKINTLDELMAKFKGKTVFVDIWATWCGPCKAEFEYGEDLEKFLKSKNAQMLYISMDKEAVEQQWRDMIKFYKLSGQHIRTNDALQKDLIDKLWGGKGYSIPRYLILKDGKLVESNALRPSNKQKLYEQIANYL